MRNEDNMIADSKRLTLTVLLLTLSACASVGYHPTESPTASPVLPCADDWSRFQQAVSRQHTFDGQDWPIPSYEYLRTDRTLSLLSKNALDAEQRRDWLARAYAKGRLARSMENQRLSHPFSLDVLESCLHQQATQLVDQPAFWRHLQTLNHPEDYIRLRRWLGLSAVLQPLISWRINVLNDNVTAMFQQYQPTGEWRRYVPETQASAPPIMFPLPQDSLELPSLSEQEWRRLFAYYSPDLVIETRGDFDIPGRPVREGQSWTTDATPTAYTQVSQTYWQGQWLPQLVYVFWFNSRPKTSPFDILGGTLDGLMWRVTLDSQGVPLFFDSVHPCGCYHKWYHVQSEIRFAGAPPGDERLIILQPPPELKTETPVIRLSSGAHYVVGLEHRPRESIPEEAPTYQLQDYNALRLIRDEGTQLSLFQPDGLVAGTQRLERFLIWSMGVPSAGAMRQWGHHAVAFASRRHLDDPLLFQRYFTTENTFNPDKTYAQPLPADN
ncbi:hypothetical protein O5O45_03305 [Hahella aquimaris]|uniref:hypothetical protein n=1 Tax=Hahella sp. HNIBRBA332 TaxID=3015983 RepID=UPI00273B9F02|nr:hypothetical protein [Hahella sp. HNIBRBA332]WLQ14957.1 hypothetical protein O5O45_03305 [Hahella sp. HNIBRBA332]